jgi:hypothetical protein
VVALNTRNHFSEEVLDDELYGFFGIGLIQFSARSLSLIGMGAGSIISALGGRLGASLLPANVAPGRLRAEFPKEAPCKETTHVRKRG